MAVSRSLRLQILRRDNHTCQSCGAKAPDVPLQVDHVVPVALGGSDEPSNLRALCEPCNSGKSATPPDAATVAQVAEDAVRWSQAMQAAAHEMLDDLDRREAHRQTFNAAWHRWSWGPENAKQHAPLPPGWTQSVDQIVAAGLPPELLKDCIDAAFANELVRRENKFKYACGVAWRKVRKIQEAAQTSLGVPAKVAAGGADEAYRRGRFEVAHDLLSNLDEDEQERQRAYAREYAENPLDEVALEVTAVEYAMSEAYHELARLRNGIADLLSLHPDDLVEGWKKTALTEIELNMGDDYNEYDVLVHTMRIAKEDTQAREAAAYLRFCSADQLTAWVEYGRVIHELEMTLDPWLVRLNERIELVQAAKVAREVRSGRRYTALCLAPGEHIEVCPELAVFSVVFDELECCASDATQQDHGPHGFCAKHIEQAVEHGWQAPSGRHFAARDFFELGSAQMP